MNLRMTILTDGENLLSQADVQKTEASFKEIRSCMCNVLRQDSAMRHVEEDRWKHGTHGSPAFTLADSEHLTLGLHEHIGT